MNETIMPYSIECFRNVKIQRSKVKRGGGLQSNAWKIVCVMEINWLTDLMAT